MARPFKKEVSNKQIMLRLTESEFSLVCKLAEEQFRTPTDLVRAIVLEYLKNNKNEKEI